MQISDEMVEKAARIIDPNAFSILDGGDKWRIIHSHYDREEAKTKARSALKAALSAAEPSVAVKDLEWKGPDSSGEYHSLGGLWGYIIRAGNGNGFWLTEIGDYFTSPEAAQAAAQADYEARIRSALTAQVQDVAGWQSMDSAPKDGKHCLLAVKSDCFVYAVQGAFMMEKWENSADIKSEPLCWMPLTRIPQVFLPWTDEFAAAAPANQEGKP